MDKNELYRELIVAEELSEKNKLSRTIKAVCFFGIVIFVFIMWIERPTGLDILAILAFSLLLGGINFFISTLILLPMFYKSQAENFYIESLKKKISELE